MVNINYDCNKESKIAGIMKKVVLLTLLILSLAVPVYTAGTVESGKTSEIVEIDFQIWVTPNLTVEYWEDLVADFHKKNPDIKVNLVQAITGESTADNFLRTRLAAGNFPDVCHVFTEDMFIEAGALMPLPIDDDVKRLRNLKGMIKDDGNLYTYDSITLVHGLIYYNKQLFEKAGITQLPKTQAEFDVVCEKLLTAGIVPISVAGADWTSGFVFSILSAPQVYYNNTQWYKDRNAKKVSFYDTDWTESATRFKNMYEKGYIYKGAPAMDYTASQQFFLDGKAAMYPMGSWFSGSPEALATGFEIGVIAPPTKDGGSYLAAIANRNGYGVSAKTKHPEAAIALAKYMGLDPYPVSKRLALEGGFSDMENAEDYTYDMTYIQNEINDLYKNTKVMTNNYNHPIGANPPDGFTDSMTRAAQTLLTGGSVKAALSEMENYWTANQK